MSLDVTGNSMEWREHLSYMMSMERQSGEFLLASVVHDSLLYNLQHHADSDTLLEIAHLAAEVAVETAASEMGTNAFAITESIRGVMHTMATLGGTPEIVAVAITTGALDGIAESHPSVSHSEYAKSIVNGLVMGAEDLGQDPDNIQRIAEHIILYGKRDGQGTA